MTREEYERLQNHLTKLLQNPPFEYQLGKRRDGWRTAILAAKSMLHSDGAAEIKSGSQKQEATNE